MQIILTLRQCMLGGWLPPGTASARLVCCMNGSDSSTTQALAPLQALRLRVNVCTRCVIMFSVLLVSAVFFSWSLYVTLPHSKRLWHQTIWPLSHNTHTGLCATLTLTFLCSLLHVHVWMSDCILAEKLLDHTNTKLNSTQTISSPVQVTQPSSTQDSFAKSNGPAPSYPSYSLSVFLCHSQLGWTSLPPKCKDGRWWLGCLRPHRWMGNSHWIIWVGGMFRSECNTFKISGPSGTMLQIQWFCCCCLHCYSWCWCYCRSHTLERGGKVLFYKHCCPLYIDRGFIYTLYTLSFFISLPHFPPVLSSFFASCLSIICSAAAVEDLSEWCYMQPTQPHLMVFSTSSLKEVPSLHSKVYFRRFIRWLAQQAPVSQAPVHSTQETMRVVWQIA